LLRLSARDWRFNHNAVANPPIDNRGFVSGVCAKRKLQTWTCGLFPVWSFATKIHQKEILKKPLDLLILFKQWHYIAAR
jgi:hypothetical protein